MFKHLLTITLIALFLNGCTTVRVLEENEITVVDPEKMDQEVYGKLKYEPTPDRVVVGDEDGIIIEVVKREIITDENAGNMKLQTWNAVATNTTPNDKCVTPMWRLMDFEYISDGPSEQLVRGHDIKTIGVMQQRTWIIDGVVVAPPPSGYLADMRVRGTVEGAKQGEECMHITNEDDIEEYDD